MTSRSLPPLAGLVFVSDHPFAEVEGSSPSSTESEGKSASSNLRFSLQPASSTLVPASHARPNEADGVLASRPRGGIHGDAGLRFQGEPLEIRL